MIKEDIPYLKFTHFLQLMVQTLNKTAIYHIKIFTQHKRAPKIDIKTKKKKMFHLFVISNH